LVDGALDESERKGAHENPLDLVERDECPLGNVCKAYLAVVRRSLKGNIHEREKHNLLFDAFVLTRERGLSKVGVAVGIYKRVEVVNAPAVHGQNQIVHPLVRRAFQRAENWRCNDLAEVKNALPRHRRQSHVRRKNVLFLRWKLVHMSVGKVHEGSLVELLRWTKVLL